MKSLSVKMSSATSETTTNTGAAGTTTSTGAAETKTVVTSSISRFNHVEHCTASMTDVIITAVVFLYPKLATPRV